MSATLVIMAAGLASRYGGAKQIEKVGPGGEILMEYTIHDAQRAAGDHFGALGAVHFGFRNDAGAIFVDRLDVRGERLLAHLL